MKKILAIALALALSLSLMPIGAFAQSVLPVLDDKNDNDFDVSDAFNLVVASGECGDDLAWKLYDNGTLVISGEGDMWDYHAEPAPWGDDFTELVIEDGVKRIGLYAFSDCTSLVSASIGGRMTVISEGVFYGCTSLISINIPDSVTMIGWTAFADCDSLVSITLPNSVTTIDTGAFSFCDSLTSVIIPDSVTSIDDTAFFDCPNLTIYGKTGSYAETYAAKNGILFEALDESTNLPGDVNGDDVVNNKDLGLLQRYINGWNVDVNVAVADVNGDGNINNKDLGLLQRYINGWDVELV